MKRFTEKRDVNNVIPLRNAICDVDVPYWRIDRPDDLHGFLSGDAADKLAAYEDTGYTPEEVAQMGAALKMQALMVQEASAVWNAQQEGRVIVLPCKVGDTVYIHSPSIGSNREIVLPKEISCASEIVKWIENKCFGNTVFLTMEEAVSALKEKYDA